MTSTDPAGIPDMTEGGAFVDAETLAVERANMQLAVERAEESLRDLQREDRGWSLIGAGNTDAPAHATLLGNADLVRGFADSHPMFVRAKTVRAAYVFGEGVTITGYVDGVDKATTLVDDVVREFVEDVGNAAAWFGHTAAIEREHDLFSDGNLFAGHWVNPRTGDVKVRVIPFNEITEIRTAPGDYATPHLYLRQWAEGTRQFKAWLPDLDYDPVAKPIRVDGVPVLWPGRTYPGLGNGCAVLRVRVNPVGRSAVWGVGDGWSALTWVRRYSAFLQDTQALYEALTKIARFVSSKGNPAATARAAAQATLGPAGGTMYGDAGSSISTPSFNGVDPSLGRPYAAMVAAGVGLPVTVLTADPGQEGARAVAETLDRPMRLAFQARQRVWADAYRASIMFKLRMCVEAPNHPLKGTVRQVGDRKIVDWPQGQEPVIDVIFPDIQDDNLEAAIEAVSKAAGTNTLHPLTIARLLLTVLEVEDVEGELARITGEDGEWVDPQMSTAMAAGMDAARRARQGDDL